MITHRLLQAEDYELLANSLASDIYHRTTSPLFFVEPGTVTSVYEDEAGPVMFVRGKAHEESNIKSIRLDIQYVSNADRRRNMVAMLQGFPELVANAKINGFNRITFDSDAPLLRSFCVKRLGFQEKTGQTLEFMIQ